MPTAHTQFDSSDIRFDGAVRYVGSGYAALVGAGDGLSTQASDSELTFASAFSSVGGQMRFVRLEDWSIEFLNNIEVTDTAATLSNTTANDIGFYQMLDSTVEVQPHRSARLFKLGHRHH
jgi:hypothetical protein